MRLIFEMSRNSHLTHKEIADELGISPQTVRTQVRNALRILRVKVGTNIFFILF
jgi:RNA polymerase sigma-70 factor (ECF subfamily)